MSQRHTFTLSTKWFESLLYNFVRQGFATIRNVIYLYRVPFLHRFEWESTTTITTTGAAHRIQYINAYTHSQICRVIVFFLLLLPFSFSGIRLFMFNWVVSTYGKASVFFCICIAILCFSFILCQHITQFVRHIKAMLSRSHIHWWSRIRSRTMEPNS